MDLMLPQWMINVKVVGVVIFIIALLVWAGIRFIKFLLEWVAHFMGWD